MAAGEGEHAHACGGARQGGDRLPVRQGAAQAGLVTGLGQPPAAAAVHQRRRQLAGRQPVQRLGQARAAGLGRFHQLRARGADRDPAHTRVHVHPQGQQPGHAFLQQQARTRLGQAGLEHGVGGAHAGVASEGHLLLRAEHAEGIAGAGPGRRQHEGGFRQPGPARDGLHGRIVQSGGVEHHGQGIAGTGAVGEHIGLDEGTRNHGADPVRVAGEGSSRRLQACATDDCA